MNPRLRAVLASAAALAAFHFACSASESGEGNAESDYTRQGGVLGQAPKLTLGRAASSTIKNAQIDAWSIDLKVGDKITVVETIRAGTLTPDFGLFQGGFTYVASASHEALPRKLTKHYVIPSTGRYYFGVAPYQGRGTGDYSIKVTCTGGPCNGEPAIVELDQWQKNVCTKKARECAIVKARPTNPSSSVTLTQAKAAWKTCLEGASLPTGESCKTACDEGEAKATCEAITKLVPFYAKKPTGCTAVLNDCMDQCEDAGDHSEVSEDQCLVNGFNNTCDGYAKQLTACGGPHAADSKAACHRLCEANFGAWNDDLDTICTETCGEYEE
jgi:hypothetical protein